MTHPNLIETIEKALEKRKKFSEPGLDEQWIRALLEDKKRLTSDRDYWFELYQQERELSKGQKEYLRHEVEKVKAELHTEKVHAIGWQESYESLLTELSAAREAIYKYSEMIVIDGEDRPQDVGMLAREFLSQYPPRREEHEA